MFFESRKTLLFVVVVVLLQNGCNNDDKELSQVKPVAPVTAKADPLRLAREFSRLFEGISTQIALSVDNIAITVKRANDLVKSDKAEKFQTAAELLALLSEENLGKGVKLIVRPLSRAGFAKERAVILNC